MVLEPVGREVVTSRIYLAAFGRVTHYPETETQRTPLATAAAGTHRRDATGTAAC